MKYDVRFLKEAMDDLEEIILHIAQDSKKEALKMHYAIMEKVNLLCSFPKIGRVVPDIKMSKSGFRMLIVEPYIVFYRGIGETIYIYRVLHGAMNYPMLYGKISKQPFDH